MKTILQTLALATTLLAPMGALAKKDMCDEIDEILALWSEAADVTANMGRDTAPSREFAMLAADIYDETLPITKDYAYPLQSEAINDEQKDIGINLVELLLTLQAEQHSEQFRIAGAIDDVVNYLNVIRTECSQS